MSRRRGTRRLATWAGVEVCTLLALYLLGYHVRIVPLTLALTLGLAVVWLVGELVVDDPAPWAVDRRSGSGSVTNDVRLATYVRVLEDHRAARVPSGALRDRLAAVAAARLEAHHGLRLDDPRSAGLLGQPLAEVATGPVRRLTPAEIDACITRIEEL